MQTKKTQISALVSSDTREMLERRVRATGIKKGYLVEQALHHYLLAMEQIPAEYIIRPKLVVTRGSGRTLFETDKTAPSTALRELMRDGNQGSAREA
ncbi:MAG: hypothetical protein EXR28_06630 [Betaproteobacteria bacterium]|nr:hypothetical protein [Betaproteobacteria bacterium]